LLLAVSLLFATLAEGSISVAAKGFTQATGGSGSPDQGIELHAPIGFGDQLNHHDFLERAMGIELHPTILSLIEGRRYRRSMSQLVLYGAVIAHCAF
jgi:hypothetical protein